MAEDSNLTMPPPPLPGAAVVAAHPRIQARARAVARERKRAQILQSLDASIEALESFSESAGLPPDKAIMLYSLRERLAWVDYECPAWRRLLDQVHAHLLDVLEGLPAA